MTITSIGFILIPVSLIIFCFRPKFLVSWAVIVSAFQAASVFNIGGGFAIGISPYFFVVSLVAIRFAADCLQGRLGFKRGDMALEVTRPLLMLMLWGVASAFLLPHLFAGVHVDTPRLGMDPVSTTPLEWSMSNAAQAGYLVLNSVFVIYVMWRCDDSAYVDQLTSAFVWSGAIAAAIGAYQLSAHILGFRFPAEIFNSNAGWQQLVSQKVAGAWRVSATFNEPSSAGIFFAAWTTYLLFLTIDRPTATGVRWFLLWCGIVMLILTTSTTGYLTSFILIALLTSGELFSLVIKGNINEKLLFTFAAIATAVGAAVLFIPDFHQLLSDILWYKSQSHSGQERSSTILVALDVVMQSLGLGVGLGSNRPSGMLFYILSNIGIPGSILIVGLITATRRVVVRAMCNLSDSSTKVRSYTKSAAWALVMYCVAMCIAGADISSPQLWILWSLLLGFARYSLEGSRPASMSNIDYDPVGSIGSKIVLLTPELRVG
jgi:hypothetical protein